MPWHVPVLVDCKVHISSARSSTLTWTRIRQTTQNKAVVRECPHVDPLQSIACGTRSPRDFWARSKLTSTPHAPGIPTGLDYETGVRLQVIRFIDPAVDCQVRSGCDV